MIPIEYKEGQRLSERCECAECHGILVVAWGGVYGVEGYVLMCSQDREHTGLVERESLTQAHRRGAALPVVVSQEMDRRGALSPRRPLSASPKTGL